MQRRILRMLVPMILACGPTPEEAVTIAVPDAPDLRRCKPAPGTTGSPDSIADVVSLANGLPFPVTAECLVEALDRPLRIEATTSQDSLQKAQGQRSPRVFVWSSDRLLISVVLDGPDRDLVEFGEFVGPRRAIKAELEFPLTEPASLATAYDRVRNPEHPGITRCFVCHDREEDEPGGLGARSSLALRPRPKTLVSIDELRAEHARCDPATEPARCRWLAALFAHGPVEHRPFAPELPVF